MEKVIIFVLAASLLALLFSRVHFHFSFNLTMSRDSKVNLSRKSSAGSRELKRRESLPGGGAPAVRSIANIANPSVTKAIDSAKDRAESDLFSALVNLGCEKGKAQNIARSAMSEGKDFDSRLKWALAHAA